MTRMNSHSRCRGHLRVNGRCFRTMCPVWFFNNQTTKVLFYNSNLLVRCAVAIFLQLKEAITDEYAVNNEYDNDTFDKTEKCVL